MQAFHNISQRRLWLALTLAALVHTLIFTFLLTSFPAEQPQRTIRVTIVDESVKRSINAVSSQAFEQNAPTFQEQESASTVNREVITTKSEAERKQGIKRDPTQQAKQEAGQQVKTPNIPVPSYPSKLPDISTVPVDTIASENALASFDPMLELFRAEEKAPVTQKSTINKPEISEYEGELRRKIAEHSGVIYEPSTKLLETVTAELQLRLLTNGAAKSARISQSSGVSAIDKGLVRMALSASPFPPPPEWAAQQDYVFAITYEINPPER